MAHMRTACLIVALSLLTAHGAQLRESAAAKANPVRKVVSLLEKMKEKVEAEGEKEEELYRKFSCYCKEGAAELEARVAAAGNKSPELQADIAASEEQLKQAKAALKTAQTERHEAKAAVASATAMREKGATAFSAEKAELAEYISQIDKAVSALTSGMAGSFLQTNLAATLRRLVGDAESVSDDDKEIVLSFLSGKYVPKSGEVTGILKDMGDSFSKSLKDATVAETAAIQDHEALLAAKAKEINVLTASIEAKLGKIGELGIYVVQMKADLEDVAGSLYEDKKLLAEMTKSCATKDQEHETRKKTRHEELLAISETIKILNDDDALELFKKTLPAPSASLVQLQVTKMDMRHRATAMIQKAQEASPGARSRLGFLVLALRGKKVGFAKVIGMIDEMIAQLKKEQMDDEYKREYCTFTVDQAEDKKKLLRTTLSDTKTAISSSEEQLAALAEEIAEAEASIKALDKSVSEATSIRNEESKAYDALIQSDTAATQLLSFAKNRLNKFYNPKLYNPPAKKELSEMGAIERDMSFVQISQQVRFTSRVPPPPETWDAYAKKTEESSGVIAMIDLLIKDLDTEMTEATTEEKNSQEEYDKTIADAKEDRVGLSKTLKLKVAAKADLTSDLETLQDTEKSTARELMATDKYLADLHGECDFLLRYFEVRKEARAGEMDSLAKAKAVLSGADYSLL